MDRPSLNEQIDACRPGHDDPDDMLLREELAPLAERLADDPTTQQRYQRLQQLDAAITSAMHDVPVPEGLAERLLAGLPDAANTDADAPVLSVEEGQRKLLEEDACPPATTAALPIGWWRRRSVLAIAAVAASFLAVFSLGIYWWLQPAEITVAQVQQEITKDYDAYVVLAGGWRKNPGSARFPFPKSVLANQNAQRFRKATVWGYPADVHDLLGPQAPFRATLFVIKRRVTGLPTSVRTMQPITGAMLGSRPGTLGIWQDDEYVYVLAVESNPDDFHQFLKTGGTLARLDRTGNTASL